jgi:two-component system, OmpR family, sensor kinase
MAERLAALTRRSGTRARLVTAIALIVLAALAATFVAVYRGTGSDLRGQVDRDLGEDASGLLQHVRTAPGSTAANVSRNAQRYINSQPTFGPSSELFVVKVSRAPLATNEPELLGVRPEPGESAREAKAEAGEPAEILSSPDGYSTITLADTGDVRLLTRPLFTGTRRTGQVTVGEPLKTVQTAQSGISRTFLLAGSIALVAAIAAGALVAGLSTRPLRRMAGTAREVDAGELSMRMEPKGPAETRRLAESFNHMLDRLEEAFARQRAFVSDASHELRTPLTAIRGQIEVLARDSEGASAENVRATASVVTREVDRMQRLVDDMLLLAQSDEGLAHDPRPTELQSLLTEALDGITGGRDRRVELRDLPTGTVIADRERIIQVIRNLVANAVEHTSAGGLIELDASAARGSIRISVSDDGPGIPEEQRERIFVRFHRLESARDRTSGGTGLGLAIARAIVEAHGGRIWADESRSGGARITFELPGYRTHAS